MKKLIPLLLLAFCMTKSRAQSCATAISPGAAAQYSCSSTCTLLFPYVPAPNDSVIYVRLNVWLPRPSVGVGQYDAFTLGEMQQVVDSINKKLANIKPRQLPYYPSPSYVSNAKIKIILNQFSKPIDDYAYYQPNQWPDVPAAYRTSSNAIDMIFQACDGGGFSYANSVPGNYIGVIGNINNPPLALMYISIHNLTHELCHCFGLNHPNLTPPLGFCRDYFSENNPDACVVGDTTKSNNIMNNAGGCGNYLSPFQLACCKYQLLTNPILIPRRTFNGTMGGIVTPTDYTLTGTQTITTLSAFGNITIPTGASITINNLNMKAGSNTSKITVEKGASLIMNCVVIEPQNAGTYWRGIELLGYSWLPQSPSNQGLLILNSCTIIRAVKGIAVGKMCVGDPLCNDLSGGGIVFADQTRFVDNYTCVDMAPKSTLSIHGAEENLASFTKCEFITQADDNDAVRRLVRLNGIKGAKFDKCYFNMNKNIPSSDTLCCIKGINSSIKVTESDIYLPNSTFNGADYGVFLTNCGNSLIEKTDFNTKNGIYLGSSNYDKIVNNTFNLGNVNPQGVLATGIYLDHCNQFKIEGNNLSCSNGGIYRSLTEGIVANTSGVNPNRIYNNTFYNLAQAMWCQNQNYDPITFDGLALNCNTFDLCDYFIGVQSSGYPQLGMNTGIAKFQGIPSNVLSSNVRNTYNNMPVCGNYNKFFSFTPFNTPPQVTHGNFTGTQYRVGPQPYCSDLPVVNDLSGPDPGLTPFNSYCPDQSALPAHKSYNYGTDSLLVRIGSLKGQLNNVDKGNTQKLLDTLGYLTLPAFKNIITAYLRDSVPYLSDTVMKAFFANTHIGSAQAYDVFHVNGPVSLPVWQSIEARGFSDSYMDNMITQQGSDSLSPRNLLEGELSLTKGELSYGIMHRIMCLVDSAQSGDHSRDTIAALIRLNNQGDVAKQLIDLDIKFAEYDSALVKISAYVNSAKPQTGVYANFMTEYVNLLKDTLGLYALTTNTTSAAFFHDVADSLSHPCRLMAQSVIDFVFNEGYDIEKLQPPTGSSRPANSTVAGEQKESKARGQKGIRIFPNPASNELTVENYSNTIAELRIYNVSGQLLLQNTVEAGQQKAISTEILQNGIYFVNLTNPNGLNNTGKLVIVK